MQDGSGQIAITGARGSREEEEEAIAGTAETETILR